VPVDVARAEPFEALSQLSDAQAGAVSRRQLRGLGVSRGVVRTRLRNRQWQRVHPGTYVVFTGPLPPLTRIWAALLYAGDEAVASHGTAGWLQRLVDDLPARVDVCVPHGHRHRGSRPGVRVRQSRHLRDRRHPAHLPPRTRLEETVLDLTDSYATADQVVTLVLRACQRRLTTAARLALRARRRKRLRWRRLISELLAEVREGVHSALERRYFRDVERAHGLPRGTRNLADGSRGRRRYRDVRYRRWRVVVELDGRAAHPDEWQERDDLRDNEVVSADDTRTLRYGWISVAGNPCRTAEQVGRVLNRSGWPGRVQPCGPGCTAV
jgi:hypothetical protein